MSSQKNQSSYIEDISLHRQKIGEMANKSVVAVVVLFCVAGIIEVQAWSERTGGGSISSDGVWGKKDDFYYHVPPRAAAVTLSKTDSS